MIAAIAREIELTAVVPGETLQTIYFGGGTPSLLPVQDIELLLLALQQKFIIAASAEVTLEANPDDVTPARLQAWKAAGINRFSLGIQSFVEDELVWMNRAHTATDALKCIDEVQQAGFTNFSVDLIYGSPLLTDAQWKANVDLVIEKKIPHISCYALTVESSTALQHFIEKKLQPPVDAEKQSRQFILLMQWLKAAGYQHYEISNFALPGRHSRHNSSYWQGRPYYGFGPSAHAYNGTDTRRWNIANNVQYIKQIQQGILPYEEEKLSTIQQVNEYIMIALRTAAGINKNVVAAKFGEGILKQVIQQAARYINSGRLLQSDTHLLLTDEGRLFADGIAADLFLG